MTQDSYNWQNAARLNIIVGHFGSGKTEFSINLALYLATRHNNVALADLDVVDPYFRSRNCTALFAQQGVRLISSSPDGMDADLPSMPPQVLTLMDNPDIRGVFDIGGDASGARVLARYRHRLKACGARMLCVVNANRPLTDTAEKTIAYLRSIEAAAGMTVDGIINNTHLCDKTELEDILTGAALAKEVSALTGIPVICHAVPSGFARRAAEYVRPVFPLELYMKKPWE